MSALASLAILAVLMLSWAGSATAQAPLKRPPLKVVAANGPQQGAPNTDANVIEDLDAPIAQQQSQTTDKVIDEQNLLILNIGVDEYLLYEGMLGYDDGSQVFLPFETFMEAIAFPISSSGDLRTAKGWFLSEDSTFHLDRNAGQVTIKGRTTSFPAYQVRDDGFGLYVSTLLLEQWFPIDFDVSVSKLLVMLKPHKPLPIQDKLARMQGRRITKRGTYSVNLPVRGLDYESFSVHGVDLYMSNNLSKHETDDDTTSTNRYALTYTGDLAFMNTKIYMNGKDNDVDNYVENLRITGERIDPTGSMLGPLGATRVVVGDVDTVRFPGQGTRSNERGIYIENRELGGSNLYDTTTIIGDSLPDWEVELYHNGRLLGVVDVKDDGRYEFSDVQLYYGRNDVILQFYGPEGQRRTENRSIDVGREMLSPGDVKYGLSLIEQNSQTIEYKTVPRGKDNSAIMGTGVLNFGVTDWFSLFTGVNSIQLEKIRHNYIYMGTSMRSPQRIYFRADGLVDTNGGQKIQASLNKGFNRFSLNLKQESFFNDYNDQTLGADERIEHRSTGSLEFGLPLSVDNITFSNSIDAQRTEYKFDPTYYSIGHSITSIIHEDTTLSHSLSSSGSSDQVSSMERIAGGVTFRGDYNFENNPKIGRIELYGDVAYSIRPRVRVDTYDFKFTERWSLSRHLSAFATLRREKEDAVTSAYNGYGGGLSITLGKLIISPSISYSDNGYFTMDTSFNMPLGLDPRSAMPSAEERNTALTGGASVRLFLDRNYNYIYDEGDEPLNRVFVKATQMGLKERTNEKGIATLNGLSPYRPVDIEVDKDENWNYFWTLVTDGEAIYSRPGKTYTLDYPVQVTGEIDGNIYLAGRNDSRSTSVPLELVDGSGMVVDTIKSSADGFYLFKEVRPGSYVVRPSPEFLLKRKLFAMPSQVLTINDTGEAKSWVDIALYPSRSELIADSEERFTEASTDLAVVKGFDANAFATAPKAHGNGFVANKGFTAFAAAPVAAPVVALAAPARPQGPSFGVHVASYSSREAARAAIAELRTNGPEGFADTRFTVSPVFIEGKGTFYRVVAGPFGQAEAQAFNDMATGQDMYARVVEIP